MYKYKILTVDIKIIMNFTSPDVNRTGLLVTLSSLYSRRSSPKKMKSPVLVVDGKPVMPFWLMLAISSTFPRSSPAISYTPSG